MATEFIYSVASDTATGAVRNSQLQVEIDAVFIPGSVVRIDTNGDELLVETLASLSAPQEIQLTDTVNAHVPLVLPTGSIMYWDGTTWATSIITPASGEVTYWDGAQYQAAGIFLDDLLDVDVPSPGVGEFLGWSGSEWAPATPGGMGGPRCVATGVLTPATTSAGTFTQMDGMFLTPPSGHWHALFSSSAGDNKNGTTIHAAIFVDGVIAMESERQLIGQSSNRGNFNCQAVVVLDGTQLVEIRWYRDGTSGVSSVDQRLLILIECAIA